MPFIKTDQAGYDNGNRWTLGGGSRASKVQVLSAT